MTRLLIAAAALIGAGCVQAQEIKIGVAGPITGPLAFLGQHMKWAGELATDELNQKGGVLGRKLVFLMQDSACRPADRRRHRDRKSLRRARIKSARWFRLRVDNEIADG